MEAQGAPPDTLKIYGFSFDFPSDARLEFNPKFDRTAGDVAVKFPGARLFLTWGSLDKLPTKVRGAEDHATFSIGRVKSSTRGKATILEHGTRDVNGHEGVYNRVKAETQPRGMFGGKTREEEARSIHVHCEQSGRYFVVFAALGEGNYDRQATTFDQVVASLKCH